jgi:AcrR family transcriptional regulator
MVPPRPMHRAPGRQALPQEVLDAYKRERVAVGVAEVVREVGVNQLTVALVTTQAKMARNTFYELFSSREDALSQAFDLGSGRLAEAMNQALDGDGSWEERVRAALDSLIDAIAANQALAELCLVHAAAVSAGETQAPVLVETLAGLLRPGRKLASKPGPGPLTETLLAFGILGVIAERLRRGEAVAANGLGEDLASLAIMPFRERRAVPNPR